MKRSLFVVLVLLPSLLFAGVIVKKNGESLEDVSITSITDTDIEYISEKGKKLTIPKSEVSAILHDDGRYEELKQSASPQEMPSYTENNDDNNADYSETQKKSKSAPNISMSDTYK